MAASITIKPNGQTVVVSAVTESGSNATVYRSSTLSGTYALPLTISNDTALWFPGDSTYTVTLKDGTGSVIYAADIVASAAAPASVALDSQPLDMVVNVKDYGALGNNTTDDYAAITRAISGCPTGGVVYFPPGQYVVTDTIAIPANITIRGSWGTRWPQYGGINVYLKPKFGSFLGDSLLKATETDGWRLENITLQSGRATGPASAVVHGLYCVGAVKAVRIQNVMINNMSGHGLFTDSTANGWAGGWEVSHLNVMNCAQDGWRSDNSGSQSFAFSDSRIFSTECGANSGNGFYWAGLAATDFIGLQSTFNTGGYGFAVVGSCSNVNFTACQTDRSKKDGFYLNIPEATSAIAPAPHIALLTSCTASRDGKNANGGQGGYAGFRVVGTSTSSPNIPVSLTGCQVHISKDDDGSGQLSPDYGLLADNGRRVLVNGCVLGGTVAATSDNNAAIIGGGGNAYYTVDFTTGAVTFDSTPPPQDGPPSSITPADVGYKAWSYDPTLASGATATTAGVLWLQRVQIRKPVSVTKLYYGVVSIAGLSLTSSQCFAGLFDSTGQRVAVTADISAGFTAGNSELAFTLTGAVTLQPGYYWAAMLLNGSTLPTLARCQGQIGGLGNSQVGSAKRFGTVLSAQTTMPTSFTPSSIANAVGSGHWVGLV